jgi:dolichol-phosphate mannosyltransferase
MPAVTPSPHPLLVFMRWLQRFRYIKFGIVGASGTVVNIAVLYLAQEYIFQGIPSPKLRLSVSLVVAIFVATLNNFTWNRLWTWADRHAAMEAASPATAKPLLLRLAAQFGQYCFASWFGMAFQFGMTLWLSHSMDYRVANILSIVLASAINFLANDRWTFRQKRGKSTGV